MSSTRQIEFLSPDNTRFFLSQGGFLMMSIDEGESIRVIPYYAFPLEMTDGYVGIYDEDFNELGMIKKIDSFAPEQAALIKKELARRYYSPKIKQILSVKNKMGLSIWTCVTAEGEKLTLSVKDAYKSMIRVNEKRVFIVDKDGARYEIEDLEKLDKKSFHKMELYL